MYRDDVFEMWEVIYVTLVNILEVANLWEFEPSPGCTIHKSGYWIF